MVSEGRNHLGSHWWLTALPGLTVAAVTLSVNRLARAATGRLRGRARLGVRRPLGPRPGQRLLPAARGVRGVRGVRGDGAALAGPGIATRALGPAHWADPAVDLYPVALRDGIDAFNAWIHHDINNGLHRVGHEADPARHAEFFDILFDRFDVLERRLAGNRHLFGATVTEPDARLWLSLVRLDVAYPGLPATSLSRRTASRTSGATPATSTGCPRSGRPPIST